MSVKTKMHAPPRSRQGAAPRRRSPAGGYPRGEETRSRIIAAALKVFAAEGFDRGSTRAIAAEAGVPPPALQYYFEGKEGLHRACAEFIIETINPALAEPTARAEATLAGGSPQAAREALCALLEAVAEFIATSPDAEIRSRFLGRGQSDSAGPAFPLIRDRITRPVHAICSRLVAQALGTEPEGAETRLRASVILGALTPFHTNRDNTLAIMGWRDFSGDRLAIIKTVLRAHTCAALSSP